MNQIQQHAQHLHDTYGWNIVPMEYFFRDKTTGNKRMKLLDWQQYKSEIYPINEWKEEYKASAIITGKISNLTVLDIDSEESLNTILNELQLEKVEDLASYVVKTYKGFQLFYLFEPNTTTRIGIKDKVDFLNGGITFAVGTNDSYEVIKDGQPTAMPEGLKALILDNEYKEDDPSVKAFERALRENSDLPYKNPLQPLVKEFIDAGKIGRHIKAKLEKVFCTKDYQDYTLDDFSKAGQIHSTMMYVGGIVASNPTVNEDLTIDFMQQWAKRVAKIDIQDSRELSLIQNRIKGIMKYFKYDVEWQQKSRDIRNPSTLAQAAGFHTWYNPETDKYAVYNPVTGITDKYALHSYKIAIVRALKATNPQDETKPADIDATLITKRYETFDPTVDEEFFIDPSTGADMHNNFKRSKMLKHFRECTPNQEIPEYIGQIIHHIYPQPEEREMFLHTLAYHMTYLQVSPTCYILTGKAGTGKNIVLHDVLKEIYGDTFLSTTANNLTGRFRNQLKNKLLVFIDELNERTNKDTVQGSFHNVIKQVVSNKTIELESKGKDTETYPNHSLFMMASNQDNPIRLEEGFDRRINITKTADENLIDLEWFTDVPSREERDSRIASEVPAFVEYLASIDLDKSKWSSTIDNAQRKALIGSSIPILDQYAAAIIDLDIEKLYDLDHDLAEWLERTLIKPNRATVTLKEFQLQVGDRGRALTKKLKASGIVKKLNASGQRSLLLNPRGSDKHFKSTEM